MIIGMCEIDSVIVVKIDVFRNCVIIAGTGKEDSVMIVRADIVCNSVVT